LGEDARFRAGRFQQADAFERFDEITLRFGVRRQLARDEPLHAATGGRYDAELQRGNGRDQRPVARCLDEQHRQIAEHEQPVQDARQGLVRQRVAHDGIATQARNELAGLAPFEEAEGQAEHVLEEAEHHLRVQARA